MAAAKATYPIVAWKVFTNFPDLYDGSGNAWRLDDGDPRSPGRQRVPRAGRQARRTGGHRAQGTVDHARLHVTAHVARRLRSRGQGPPERRACRLPLRLRAERHRRAVRRRARANVGVNRLITSMRSSGVGPNENMYAELGTTWWSLMADPDQAAHLLGKLLRHVGEDNVLWGSDSLFYGAPQDRSRPSVRSRSRRSSRSASATPRSTDTIKRKVLGLNALRLHKVDPMNTRCTFTATTSRRSAARSRRPIRRSAPARPPSCAKPVNSTILPGAISPGTGFFFTILWLTNTLGVGRPFLSAKRSQIFWRSGAQARLVRLIRRIRLWANARRAIRRLVTIPHVTVKPNHTHIIIGAVCAIRNHRRLHNCRGTDFSLNT